MTVPQKSSLRSSRRSTYLPDPQPPTAPPPTKQYIGKRNHDAFLANGHDPPSKKVKITSNTQSPVKLSSKPHAYNASFTTLPKSTVGVTHTSDSSILSPRITTAVQPLANGTIITNGDSQIEVEEVRVTRKVANNGAGKGKALKVVEKRTLRSQDGGSRSKSELSLYFPNYEELISNEPKESEFLSPDTRILIVDEAPKASTTLPIRQPLTSSNTSIPISSLLINGTSQTTNPPVTNSDSLTNTQKLDFTHIAVPHYTSDPLGDEVYFKAHRRAERQEKQLRNIEKERAQHEKVQLERLLDGLRGHDWLRVMGISGITDSEKKSFEPKRDYFIREVRLLIEKFKRWKEEEKRRKVEKEMSVKADDEEGEEDDGNEDEDDEETGYVGRSNPQDVDALAALQLQNEAVSASRSRKRNARAMPAPLQPPPVEKPFTSFYSKPYLRDAAIGKHRRGRTRFAFGQPLPDLPEKAFRLPSEMLTEDALRASARSRRRARRESKDA
ncbi:hypothetical protein MMC30_006283 [Trapelia coarctata]|nr:hypothetical protein [Trapelia coarctata]